MMVGMGEISALAGSLKAASEMAKAMIGLRDAQMLQGKAIELQSAILSAQGDAMAAFTAHADLIEQVRALETKLAAFEDWDAQKQRYELKEIERYWKATVYALKEGVEPPEPMHYACPNCYENRKKRILQPYQEGGTEGLICHECDWLAWLQGMPPAESKRKRKR